MEKFIKSIVLAAILFLGLAVLTHTILNGITW